MGTLTPHIRRYLDGRCKRGEITRGTAVDYAYRLDHLDVSFGDRPLDKFGARAVDGWLESIGSKAPATRREYLSTIRGFCRWLQAHGHVRMDATAHVPNIPQPRKAPVTLTRAEVRRLLLAAPDLRARAVVALMVGCGCRCVEVSRLRVDDYDPRGRTIRLTGKARHERVIAVPTATARHLDAYLDEVGRTGGPLIRSQQDPSRGLGAHTLSHYLRSWMHAADVKARALDGRSAHGLRRTGASDVLELSGDLRAVQEMLGHRSIETTARHYLRPVTMAQLREAMDGRDYEEDPDTILSAGPSPPLAA